MYDKSNKIIGNLVYVTHDNVEKALRKFKKKVAESGLLQELREREARERAARQRQMEERLKRQAENENAAAEAALAAAQHTPAWVRWISKIRA
jgi:ribosomal protein S21